MAATRSTLMFTVPWCLTPARIDVSAMSLLADFDGVDAADAELVEGLRQLRAAIGDPAFASVCATLLDGSSIRVGDFNAAVAADDVATSRRLTSELRRDMAGSSAIYLDELADRLESPARAAEGIGAIVAELNAEYDLRRSALSRQAATN